LTALAAKLDVHVITGDTTGTARQALAALPVGVRIMPADGQRAAKCAVIDAMRADETVAIGNGCNDCGLMTRAALSIAVVGGEGCAVETLVRADVACRSVCDALDLLLNPLRLVATLRT
jgi:soluble P-type ATPase